MYTRNMESCTPCLLPDWPTKAKSLLETQCLYWSSSIQADSFLKGIQEMPTRHYRSHLRILAARSYIIKKEPAKWVSDNWHVTSPHSALVLHLRCKMKRSRHPLSCNRAILWVSITTRQRLTYMHIFGKVCDATTYLHFVGYQLIWAMFVWIRGRGERNSLIVLHSKMPHFSHAHTVNCRSVHASKAAGNAE